MRSQVLAGLLLCVAVRPGLAQAGDSTAKAQSPLAAQPAPAAVAKPDSAARAAARVDSVAAPAADAPFAGAKFSGYAEASYAYSTRSLKDAIPGRWYDRFQNQFELNAVKVALDRAYTATKLDAGFHVEALFGQNAAVTRSNGLDLGNEGDITQLFVTLNVPTPNGNGFQLKAGKMVTLLGQEVLDAPSNANWSLGNQFVFLENVTNVGVSAEYRFNRYMDTQLRLINGWDVVQDNNNGKSVMGRVGFYPDSVSTIALLGYYGAEQPGTARPKRVGGELLLNRSLTDRLALSFQGDYGHDGAGPALPDSTRAANWWGAGAWLTYQLVPAAQLALRGDYIDDVNGARTSGVLGFPVNTGQRLGSATATLNLKAWPHSLVRPEVRYDRSSLPTAFAGRQQQLSFALSVAFVY